MKHAARHGRIGAPSSMLIVELHGHQHFVDGKTIRARRSRRSPGAPPRPIAAHMFTRVPASETS
jgi:hypothetical protein